MINKKKGSETELGIIQDIIRPFYKDVKSGLKNEKILAEISMWEFYDKTKQSSKINTRTLRNKSSNQMSSPKKLQYQSL